MKILSGACRRDAGEILLDGRRVDDRQPARRRRRSASAPSIRSSTSCPHLSAAENIFLGREPLARPAFIDAAADARGGVAACCSRSALTIDPDASGSRAEHRPAADGRGRQGARRETRASSIMDEPTSALTEHGDRPAVRGDRTPHGARRRDHLHLASPGGDRAHRPPRHRLRDGRKIATRPHRRAPIAGARPADGRPRAVRSTSRAARAARDAAAARSSGLSRAARLRRRQPDACTRGEIVGRRRTARRRPHGVGPRDRRRRRRSTAGEIAARRGGPHATASPPDAIRAGIGLVPEDRKRHGLVPSLRVGENIALPHLPASSAAAVSSTGAASGSRARALDRATCASRRRASSSPVAHAERRQPAEGRARQVARRRARTC